MQKTKDHENKMTAERGRENVCLRLFCAAERKCPVARLVFLLSTQQAFFGSLKLLRESCQAESGLGIKHQATTEALALHTKGILELLL